MSFDMLYRFTTTDQDEDLRLDKYLHAQLPEFSRTSIRKIIDIGGVHISEQIHNRTAKKQYLAMISGTPQPNSGTYMSYLARERRSSRMKSVEQGGKEAITHYRVMADRRECSLVSVGLETGRTHQIRVHFSEAGHPLIGVTLYGGDTHCEGLVFPFQCLHSWKLEISHPVHDTALTFTAPPPKTMREFFPTLMEKP